MTTPAPPLSLEEALRGAVSRRVLTRGTVSIVCGDQRTRHYTKHVVDAVHPRLYDLVVEAAARLLQVSNDLYPNATAAKYAQCYWHWLNNPDMASVQAKGKSIYLERVTYINPHDLGDGLFQLCGTQYARTQDDAGRMRVAGVTWGTYVCLNEAQLEAWQPGSALKIKTGYALGMDGYALASYAFSPQDPAPACSLPGAWSHD